MPVAFRHTVQPLTSKLTNVFRPNAMQGEARAQTLGAVWLGKLETLPQTQMMDVIWEARAWQPSDCFFRRWSWCFSCVLVVVRHRALI